MKDKILFVPYTPGTLYTFASIFAACSYESFVYTCDDKSSEWLNAQADQLNLKYPGSEWLWSHPEHSGYSTPVPVLIQQDRQQLTHLRKQTGYTND